MTADGHGEIPGTASQSARSRAAWPMPNPSCKTTSLATGTAAGARQIAEHPAPGRAGAYARTGQATGVTRLCTCVPTGCGVRTR